VSTPANPSPDYLEWLAAHRANPTPIVYSPAPNVVDGSPGDTSTGYSDTWDTTLSTTGATVEVRYHFLTAQEMHGIDLTFTSTQGTAYYIIRGSLDAIHYDVLCAYTAVGGPGVHRITRNFDFVSRTYNFYSIEVMQNTATTASVITCSDCRLYSYLNLVAQISGDVTITPGQSANIAYYTQYAESVSIDQGIGSLTPNVSGNVAVSPTITTVYTITATSRYGTTTSSVTVTVARNTPPNASLSANTATVHAGDPVVLTYTTSNNTTALITPTVGGLPGNTTGTVTVYPSTTTTYILSAQGPGGETTSKVTITVSAAIVYGCMDPAALNYNPDATQDTDPTSCTYATSLPTGTGVGAVRRPVAVTVAAEIVLSSLQTDFSTPPSVSIGLTSDQKTALGLTGDVTVTQLQGLAFHSGAKLQSPTVDVTRYDPAACAARVATRFDDDGTLTLFLLPGPLSSAGEVVPELYPGGPGQTPYLVPGTWHLWTLLVLSTYRW
jgi:hypothetical protein